jgi:hypothetical protein
MPYNERERFKQWANEFKDLGFEEWWKTMVDLAHWMRYLQCHLDKPKDFNQYVEWKYTNPEGLSY